jgi:hypothetical protein
MYGRFQRIVMVALSGLALALVGCGGAESDPTPPGPSMEGCEAIAATCRMAQKGCAGATDTIEAHCESCPAGQYPDTTALCVPIAGTVHTHDFGEVTLAAGEEIESLCQSWVLNNESELWVNAVELQTDGGYHHSNWFFVPEGKHDYPPGAWYDCYNEGFGEIESALSGGVLYAQSTQVVYDVQKFGEGVAVRIPPYSRIIGATHLLNVYPEPLSTVLNLTIYTMDADTVTTKLTPFQLTYHDLHLEPNAESEVTSSCDIDALYQDVLKQPLALKLHYILPHYHALGNGFDVAIYGGERDGEELFNLGSFTADPFGRVFDPPVDLAGAKGLTFRCGFKNPTDKKVGWGIGDQEMCVLLGFAESTLAFDGNATSNTALGADENGVFQHTSNCDLQGFGFSQNKKGGEPTTP